MTCECPDPGPDIPCPDRFDADGDCIYPCEGPEDCACWLGVHET